MAARANKEVIIRNLLYVPQNMRFGKAEEDKIQLDRHGLRGDTAAVSEKQQQTTAFKMGVGRFFEVITQKEADEIRYADSFQGGSYQPYDVHVYSMEENTRASKTITTDPRTGKITERTGPIGMRAAQVPGADPWPNAAIHTQEQYVQQQQGQPLPQANPVEAPLPAKKTVERSPKQ